MSVLIVLIMTGSLLPAEEHSSLRSDRSLRTSCRCVCVCVCVCVRTVLCVCVTSISKEKCHYILLPGNSILYGCLCKKHVI